MPRADLDPQPPVIRAMSRARRIFRASTAAALIALLSLSPLPSSAETAARAPCPRTAQRRALAVGAALVPGVLAHGAGHYALCEERTAKTLLATEAVGVGVAGASLTGLALTGASRYFVGPLAVGLLGGGSLFALTLLADVYGVTAPDGGFGRAPHLLPRA